MAIDPDAIRRRVEEICTIHDTDNGHLACSYCAPLPCHVHELADAVLVLLEADSQHKYYRDVAEDERDALRQQVERLRAALQQVDRCTCGHECPTKAERIVEGAECIHADWCGCIVAGAALVEIDP